jgi:hypothetical protein
LVALVIRWLVIAYWPFTAYDTLWVFGYVGRLFALLGYIPNSIGYYPQYMALQYSYAQLAYGGISDHVARAGLPFLHLGTILAVYVLGALLFNLRVGIFAAAMWALYRTANNARGRSRNSAGDAVHMAAASSFWRGQGMSRVTTCTARG